MEWILISVLAALFLLPLERNLLTRVKRKRKQKDAQADSMSRWFDGKALDRLEAENVVLRRQQDPEWAEVFGHEYDDRGYPIRDLGKRCVNPYCDKHGKMRKLSPCHVEPESPAAVKRMIDYNLAMQSRHRVGTDCIRMTKTED